MQFKGIDVSSWQGEIDWKSVRESGISFAMLRASFGFKNPEKQTDACFYRNLKEALAQGLSCGAYHYSYATTKEEAEREAEFFLSVVKGAPLSYPVAFDLEDASQQSLSRECLTELALTFLKRVQKAGYTACLYTNLDWIKNRLDMAKLSGFELWLAQWNHKPTYEGDIGLWQYTSAGRVPGIKGNVDMNLSFKDYPALLKKSAKSEENAGNPGSTGSEGNPKNPKSTAPGTSTPGASNDSNIPSAPGAASSPAAASGKGKSYTVRPGDTLWGIAERLLGNGFRFHELAKRNGIQNPDLIFAGQLLFLPEESKENPGSEGREGSTGSEGKAGSTGSKGNPENPKSAASGTPNASNTSGASAPGTSASNTSPAAAPNTPASGEASSPAAASGKGKSYTVRPGDTLWGIAESFYGSGNEYPRLVRANGLRPPYVLHAGQVLTL